MEEKFEDVKILLCEDDENLGMLLREYLEAKGFQVDLCVDGEEGYDIFLTAKTLIEDIRAGFEIGADDYITKPFRMDVVVLRIEAILRRVRGKQNKNETIRSIGKFTFDTQKQMLTIDGEEKKLTTKEAELLTLLSNKINELLPREYALKAIWIDDNYFNARSMDVYITKLRKLLSADPNVEILNVHGKGYKLVISDGTNNE